MNKNEVDLQDIIDCCGDPIVVYDKDGLAIYINPAFERVFGWSSEELLGRRIDFVPEIARKETQKALKQILAGKAVLGMETIRKTKNRGNIHVRFSADTLKNTSRQFNGTVVTLQDITDLVQSRQEANKANQAKNNFLSNISHEIRTPMNGLMGVLDLLEGTSLNKEQQEFVAVLQETSTALMAVIAGILDFSKIESGKIECNTIDFDLRTTMDAVKKAMSARVEKKGLGFSMSVHKLVPSLLKGDPERLRQIFHCLIENAVKFTDKGDIRVSVILDRETSSHALIRFEVEDTGIGIATDNLKIIFDSFSQADSSATRKYGGTGIGLSLSKQLVSMMEGKIEVNSSPGKGSIFSVIIEFEKQPASVNFKMNIPKTIKGKKILIVDNDAASRFIIKGFLKKWGCVFDEAANADRALEKLVSPDQIQGKFDVALIDMQLSGKDGETLAKQIKSDPGLSEMILIMLSSIGKRGDVARLEKNGVEGYLPKPVKADLVFDCISTALAMKESRDKKIITRHFLLESKKQRVQILLVRLGIVDRKIIKNILNKSGYTVNIAEDRTQAKEILQTGLFNLIILELCPAEPECAETIEIIRKIENKNGSGKTIILGITDLSPEKDDENSVDDFILKPITSDSVLQVIEKWACRIETDFKEKLGQNSGAGKLKDHGNIFNFDAALERAMDDKSFLEMLVNEFIKGLPEKLDTIKASVLEKDMKTLTLQAHSLKGSALNIGADGIIAVALELEQKADVGDFESASQKINLLENEYQRFKDYIKTINWSDV